MPNLKPNYKGQATKRELCVHVRKCEKALTGTCSLEQHNNFVLWVTLILIPISDT